MAGRNVEHEGSFPMNALQIFGTPFMSAGELASGDSGDGFKVISELNDDGYRKLVLKGDVIVGFILVNQIDRAGIINTLLRERFDVSEFKDRLLLKEFGIADLPFKYRKDWMERR